MSAAIVRQLNALPHESYDNESFRFCGFSCDRARMKVGRLQVRTCTRYEAKSWLDAMRWVETSYGEEDRLEAFRGGFTHGGNGLKLVGVEYGA